MPAIFMPPRTLEVDPPLATAMGTPAACAALAISTTGSIAVTCTHATYLATEWQTRRPSQRAPPAQ